MPTMPSQDFVPTASPGCSSRSPAGWWGMRSAFLLCIALLAACQDKGVSVDQATDGQAAAPVTSPPTPFASESAVSTLPRVPVSGQQFQAHGTEPFWSLEVLDGKLLYTSPETPQAVAIAVSFSNKGMALRYSGTMAGKPVVLTIERGECSDGMSDTVYSHKSTFTWGERTEHGCARRK